MLQRIHHRGWRKYEQRLVEQFGRSGADELGLQLRGGDARIVGDQLSGSTVIFSTEPGPGRMSSPKHAASAASRLLRPYRPTFVSE